MTQYVLTDARNGARIWHPVPFTSHLAAVMFALIHDIRNYAVEPLPSQDDTLPLPLIFEKK